MKIRIEPYRTWSGGAKRLGQHAGILRATTHQVKKHGDFDIIVNWGRSERRFKGEYINDPARVENASNKSIACKIFESSKVPQPNYTTDLATAQKWVEDGHTAIARTLLRASGGRGIILINPNNNTKLPKAPLYTQYVPKKDEYRVHVFKGEVIDVQEKKRNKAIPDEKVNWQIRNHDNGFIYARGGINPPGCISDTACRAVDALGLDFGAVDLGYNAKKGECVVYEVNTAPGLEGETLELYYQALLKTFPQLMSGMYAKRRVGRQGV